MRLLLNLNPRFHVVIVASSLTIQRRGAARRRSTLSLSNYSFSRITPVLLLSNAIYYMQITIGRQITSTQITITYILVVYQVEHRQEYLFLFITNPSKPSSILLVSLL